MPKKKILASKIRLGKINLWYKKINKIILQIFLLFLKENVLPKVPNISHNKSELKYPRRASQQTGQTMKKEHDQGAMVIAPDGELLNVGHTLVEERNDRASNNDDVVYRLFDQIPPYLYFTNKLEDGVRLNYETPHSSQHSIIKILK